MYISKKKIFNKIKTVCTKEWRQKLQLCHNSNRNCLFHFLWLLSSIIVLLTLLFNNSIINASVFNNDAVKRSLFNNNTINAFLFDENALKSSRFRSRWEWWRFGQQGSLPDFLSCVISVFLVHSTLFFPNSLETGAPQQPKRKATLKGQAGAALRMLWKAVWIFLKWLLCQNNCQY